MFNTIKYEDIRMHIENEYDYLTDLCNTNPVFYYTDITDKYTNHEYRIFNYRLAKYSDFTHPIMNDCRGIMFSRQSKGVVCRSIHIFIIINGGAEKLIHCKRHPRIFFCGYCI